MAKAHLLSSVTPMLFTNQHASHSTPVAAKAIAPLDEIAWDVKEFVGFDGKRKRVLVFLDLGSK